MKKSQRLNLGVVTAVAGLTIAGCSGQSDNAPQNFPKVERHCVDAQGRVLPDSECDRSNTHPASGGSGAYLAHSAYPYPHYVYGGTVTDSTGKRILAGSQEIGGRARGFSSTAPESATIISPTGTVIRGGFGASAGEGEGGHGGEGGEGGHGGGEGGGGGHGGGAGE